MFKRKFNENRAYVACAFIIVFSLVICSVAQYFAACAEVRSDVLRLHIIANSDSDEDQAVKLAVRDRILTCGEDIFSGDISAAEAEDCLTPYLGKLKNTADEVLAENGFGYSSSAEIVYEYFDTREYDGFTLPAGKYTALKIVLGRGEGKNWWCVMFPPLCLPAAAQTQNDVYAVFSENEIKAVEPEKGYRIRFKLVEIAERLLEKIRERTGD